MLDLNLAPTEHFACEIDSSTGRKARSLKQACGSIARFRCISALSSQNVFYACGRHTPSTGYHVTQARWR